MGTSKKKKIRKNFSLSKLYFSYNYRLIIRFLLCLLFLILGVIFIYGSLNIIKEEKVTYNEKGSVDYQICLKENNFYENSCIEQDMSYVANLIKNISLTFNYDLQTNKNINLNTSYEIIANLVISNSDELSNYFQKKYILVSKTDLKKELIKKRTINKNINIDYDYYNNIASEFKSQFGVETTSFLNIYFTVYNEADEIVFNPSTTSISIPLSKKSINIKMQANDVINNNKEASTKYFFSLSNVIYLILGIISLVLSFVLIVKFLKFFAKIFVKRNNYDKYISKILREYDRLIVETSSLPKFSNYNIIKIHKFTELLDVRDNLHLPIMYYNVVTHQKCHLYILKDNNLYLLTLKDADMH